MGVLVLALRGHLLLATLHVGTDMLTCTIVLGIRPIRLFRLADQTNM